MKEQRIWLSSFKFSFHVWARRSYYLLSFSIFLKINHLNLRSKIVRVFILAITIRLKQSHLVIMFFLITLTWPTKTFDFRKDNVNESTYNYFSDILIDEVVTIGTSKIQ